MCCFLGVECLDLDVKNHMDLAEKDLDGTSGNEEPQKLVCSLDISHQHIKHPI